MTIIQLRPTTPADRRTAALHRLAVAGQVGMTCHEYDSLAGINHHGTSSSVLSMLHKAGKIARLAEKRDGCSVYVALEHVAGRKTETQGQRQTLTDDMARVLRALTKDGCEYHQNMAPRKDCALCQGARLVRIYDRRVRRV